MGKIIKTEYLILSRLPQLYIYETEWGEMKTGDLSFLFITSSP